jgi:DNA-binding transcriptional LysR family regulator
VEQCGVLDLNDLRVFEKVASLRGFSAAARELALPKSSVSRSIARLEEVLGTRLLQRTTREVVLTQTGEVLHERCVELLDRVGATVDQIAGMTDEPRGVLKIGSGIGFGINVLSELLPAFLERYPAVEVVLDLRTEFSDLIAEGFDVAVRLGPLPTSGMIAVRISSMERVLWSPRARAARVVIGTRRGESGISVPPCPIAICTRIRRVHERRPAPHLTCTVPRSTRLQIVPTEGQCIPPRPLPPAQ